MVSFFGKWNYEIVRMKLRSFLVGDLMPHQMLDQNLPLNNVFLVNQLCVKLANYSSYFTGFGSIFLYQVSY